MAKRHKLEGDYNNITIGGVVTIEEGLFASSRAVFTLSSEAERTVRNFGGCVYTIMTPLRVEAAETTCRTFPMRKLQNKQRALVTGKLLYDDHGKFYYIYATEVYIITDGKDGRQQERIF